MLYIFAGAIAVIGVNGLFGTEENSLAIVWLVFFGMPWTLALALVPASGFPQWLAQALIALLPLFNLWLLSRMCRRRRRRHRRQ